MPGDFPRTVSELTEAFREGCGALQALLQAPEDPSPDARRRGAATLVGGCSRVKAEYRLLARALRDVGREAELGPYTKQRDQLLLSARHADYGLAARALTEAANAPQPCLETVTQAVSRLDVARHSLARRWHAVGRDDKTRDLRAHFDGLVASAHVRVESSLAAADFEDARGQLVALLRENAPADALDSPLTRLRQSQESLVDALEASGQPERGAQCTAVVDALADVVHAMGGFDRAHHALASAVAATGEAGEAPAGFRIATHELHRARAVLVAALSAAGLPELAGPYHRQVGLLLPNVGAAESLVQHIADFEDARLAYIAAVRRDPSAVQTVGSAPRAALEALSAAHVAVTSALADAGRPEAAAPYDAAMREARATPAVVAFEAAVTATHEVARVEGSSPEALMESLLRSRDAMRELRQAFGGGAGSDRLTGYERDYRNVIIVLGHADAAARALADYDYTRDLIVDRLAEVSRGWMGPSETVDMVNALVPLLTSRHRTLDRALGEAGWSATAAARRDELGRTRARAEAARAGAHAALVASARSTFDGAIARVGEAQTAAAPEPLAQAIEQLDGAYRGLRQALANAGRESEAPRQLFEDTLRSARAALAEVRQSARPADGTPRPEELERIDGIPAVYYDNVTYTLLTDPVQMLVVDGGTGADVALAISDTYSLSTLSAHLAGQRELDYPFGSRPIRDPNSGRLILGVRIDRDRQDGLADFVGRMRDDTQLDRFVAETGMSPEERGELREAVRAWSPTEERERTRTLDDLQRGLAVRGSAGTGSVVDPSTHQWHSDARSRRERVREQVAEQVARWRNGESSVTEVQRALREIGSSAPATQRAPRNPHDPH